MGLPLFHLPPPPQVLYAPPLQSTQYYVVNHCVKIWHVRWEGFANNMWDGGEGTKISKLNLNWLKMGPRTAEVLRLFNPCHEKKTKSSV